jgi:UDP-N-acetylmuramoyl-tripeptide--D-alanyl-D-alanine ligase
MEARSLKYIADACGGELLRGLPLSNVAQISTDSRSVRPGDLFFALSGEQFDGHDFLPEVAAKGAAAVIVGHGRVPAWLTCGVIAVDNPRHALGRLAAHYRQDFTLPVIVVGGSNGKTTTKEIIAALLRQKYATLWSEASYNNDVGVPVTLMKLQKNHGAAVVEAGTNHPGELAPLVRMIQPQFGVITSIGREHLEFFGNIEGVAVEEGALAELLPARGKLFVNGDCELMAKLAHRASAPVVRAGWSAGCDWRALSARMDERGMTFEVASPNVEFSGTYRLGLLGRHQVSNALLAMAVAVELGLTREQVDRALAGCTPPKMRLQVWEAHGVKILDDAYNANADSMLAALQTLRELPCTGRRMAVLGDMAELGEHSAAAHVEVGQSAAECGVDRLITVGRFAGVMAAAARAAGLKEVSEYGEVAQAGSAVKQEVRPGDLVLLKASRATRLERVGEALRG